MEKIIQPIFITFVFEICVSCNGKYIGLNSPLIRSFYINCTNKKLDISTTGKTYLGAPVIILTSFYF